MLSNRSSSVLRAASRSAWAALLQQQQQAAAAQRCGTVQGARRAPLAAAALSSSAPRCFSNQPRHLRPYLLHLRSFSYVPEPDDTPLYAKQLQGVRPVSIAQLENLARAPTLPRLVDSVTVSEGRPRLLVYYQEAGRGGQKLACRWRP